MTTLTYQAGKVKYRNKRENYASNHRPSQRYSGDFDLYSNRIAPSKQPPAPVLQKNNFRRAKSSEWDINILDKNIKSLKNDCLSDFHLGSSSGSNMQTLDKRISASSDQLDCIRQDTGTRFGQPLGRGKMFSGNREKKGERRQSVNGEDVLKHKSEKHVQNEYFSNNSEMILNVPDKSGRERGRKTPFEMFLENDGPYSRKLYGQVTKDQGKHHKDHQSEKTKMKNIFTKPIELSNQLSVVAGQDIVRNLSVVKKGILWQQRDSLFSRWKERFFILTDDYFHCFKKGSSKVTEMGEFIFKVKLSSITSVSLLDKRGFLTICLSLSSVREGRIYLRRAEGLRDWFNVIKFCVDECKSRKSSWYKNTFKRVTRNVISDTSSDDDLGDIQEDETPDHENMEKLAKSETEITKPKGINRLSMVSDLLMSEAIRSYARTKEEKSEDSGVESGNSLEINGSDSQAESSSEHSSQGDPSSRDVESEGSVKVRKGEMLVCKL